MAEDDLSRNVYCILGMPIDAIGMPAVLSRIRAAAARREPFLISTPNLNFLVRSRSDATFRESLLRSDLCAADGMPIVWIARFMGTPVRDRIAGSDIFDALKAENDTTRPLNIFFFGGAKGVAGQACQSLNAQRLGLHCAGWFDPGFVSVEEMSRPEIIEAVNRSAADILVASLGATKGQYWLLRNHSRLQTPVRVHLGAVVNFQAGTVKRAPRLMRNAGLEWLWRILEEPHLWRRYGHDGKVLVNLLIGRVLPLVASNLWRRLRPVRSEFAIDCDQDDHTITFSLAGPATADHIDEAVAVFRSTPVNRKQVTVDLSRTLCVDARFLGLILMLCKVLAGRGVTPHFRGMSPRIKRGFRLHGLEFLLEPKTGAEKLQTHRAEVEQAFE